MHHEYVSWRSPALGGTHMGIHIWGHGGAKMLVFPTSLGSHREWTDRRMPQVLGDHLRNGWLQMFCVDHVHGESWYDKRRHPHDRAVRHLQYDAYVRDEVMPLIHHRNRTPYVIATGASFGGYHALCFGLRNPQMVDRIISMSGMSDISGQAQGVESWATYACNPVRFMPNEHEPARMAAFRRQDIIIATGRDDPNYQDNAEFSAMLWRKGIGNALRVWDGHAHDWPYWEKMIRLYVGGHD